MEPDRTTAVVSLLKQYKAQGLNYYDATQALAKQGFNQEEIEQASYQFPYSDASLPADNNTPSVESADQAFAQATAHEQAEDNAKSNIYKDVGLGLLGGRSVAGRYFSTKAVADYAALKDLQAVPQDGSPISASQRPGIRVFQRHRAVKYYAVLSLVPVAFLLPYLMGLIRGAVPLASALLAGHSRSGTGLVVLYVWSGLGCISYLYIAALLFLARKESVIVNSLYLVLGLEVLAVGALGLAFKSWKLAGLGLLTVLPGFWISKQVGLLAQLEPYQAPDPPM